MFLTNKKRSDGFGAQYQTIIFTILFAEIEGLTFAYSPFCEMEHNYDNDPLFIANKEDLINIKKNFPNASNFLKEDFLEVDLHHIYQTVENNLDICTLTDSFSSIKSFFYDGKENPHPAKTACLHIRRPNSHDNATYGYTEDEYFLNAIQKIKQEHSDIECIKILSQGDPKDFERFMDSNVELKLNLSVEETFINLAFSDVLVMSKSSLSYCAALLCDGIVYYLPFWHKPKQNWKSI